MKGKCLENVWKMSGKCLEGPWCISLKALDLKWTLEKFQTASRECRANSSCFRTIRGSRGKLFVSVIYEYEDWWQAFSKIDSTLNTRNSVSIKISLAGNSEKEFLLNERIITFSSDLEFLFLLLCCFCWLMNMSNKNFYHTWFNWVETRVLQFRSGGMHYKAHQSEMRQNSSWLKGSWFSQVSLKYWILFTYPFTASNNFRYCRFGTRDSTE